jgi:hypothetical protein
MSGEHLFSECLFVSKFLKTEGMRKIAPGKPIPRDSLAPNVLCVTHNSKLSGLDSEAKTLSAALRSHFESRDPREARVKVDGWKAERWLLKCLHGFVASKWVKDRAFPLDPSLVKIAFGEGRLGSDAGLYVVKKPEPRQPSQRDLVGCTVFHDLNNEGSISGAHVQVLGLGFFISLKSGDPTQSLRMAAPSVGGLDWSHAELAHRPPSIILAYHRKGWGAHERARLTLEFAW